jgi:hypothetical protein
MTPEQFAYWMQGFAELTTEPPTAEQWRSIRDHVASVFVPEPQIFRPQPRPFETLEAVREIRDQLDQLRPRTRRGPIRDYIRGVGGVADPMRVRLC